MKNSFSWCIDGLAGSQSGWAQVTGVLSGRVVDATDAGISGATVTVKTVDTGATRTATTDDSGTYRIVSVPVGQQEVRGEKPDSKRPSAWESTWRWDKRPLPICAWKSAPFPKKSP